MPGEQFHKLALNNFILVGHKVSHYTDFINIDMEYAECGYNKSEKQEYFHSSIRLHSKNLSQITTLLVHSWPLKNKSFRYLTFVALSSQKHQNIPPVTALLMHPPGPSHCTMYCDVRLGCHSALALRQDEPLLSQSQGLRVCSSSCDPFGRPSSLYCAVQTMHYTLQPHTRERSIALNHWKLHSTFQTKFQNGTES